MNSEMAYSLLTHFEVTVFVRGFYFCSLDNLLKTLIQNHYRSIEKSQL